MKKVIKGLVKGTFSPLGVGIMAADHLISPPPVADGTISGNHKVARKILLNKLPKDMRKKLKTFDEFQEAAAAVLAAPAIANKVISTGAALWGMYNTINNQGPGIKDGSGTKKGGVWDSLPKGKSSNWSKGNNLTGIAKEVEKKRNKDILKKYIKDKYGNKDQLTGGTLPEEMMGAGAIANNVGDGKIAGTVEAGDDPPKKKKKKRYVYGGKGSRKMWLT